MKRARFLLGTLLALSMWCGVPRAQVMEERYLVLISAANTRISPLSQPEVRRLFLGLPIEHEGQLLEPLDNDTDPLLREVFLQKIIFMSTSSYERQLMSQVFRSGGHHPIRYSTIKELQVVLRNKPGAVSYMWLKDIQQVPGIKVVQVLWHGPVD